MKTKYLIIGGGPAGVATVEGIRSHDKEGKIILVDAQGEPLYSKINLHFLLDGKMQPDQLYLKKQEFYEQNGVELVKNNLTNLNDWQYEKLILAPGGSPRKLEVFGADLGGIHTFYSLEDGKKLVWELGNASDVLVVGGGFITLDVVDSLQKLGKTVHLIMREKQILPGKVGPEGAKILQKRLGDKINCYFGEEVAQFYGASRVGRAVLLSGKKIDCQLVIIAIGIVPNLDLAKQLNLKINRGVVVDEFQKTNQEGVWAAGDICEFPDSNSGEMMTAGNWFYAGESGRVAGENAGGANVQNAAVPVVSKNLFGTNLFFIGNVNDKFERKEFFEENMYFCAYLKNNLLVGASAIGLPAKLPLAKANLGKKFELTKELVFG